MKDIDFLPRQYHERNANRKAYGWRVAVFVMFGGAVLTAAACQYALARSAEHRLAEVEPQYIEAVARQSQYGQLQTDLFAQNDAARLYAFLGHPWPRTRILAAIVEPLPPEVALVEVWLKRDVAANASGPARRFRAQAESTQEQAAAATPASDLRRLREEIEAAPTVAMVSGKTTDAAALHRYVEKLEQSQHFVRVEHESLQSPQVNAGSSDLAFELRLVVRPGYGIAGGPHEVIQARTSARRAISAGGPTL